MPDVGNPIGPRRLRLSRAEGFDLQAASRALNGRPAVKVDRSTAWGNPFVVGRDGTAARCVALYRALLSGHPTPGTLATVVAQRLVVHRVERSRGKLAGCNLACWCRLDTPCHAEVLLELVNA